MNILTNNISIVKRQGLLADLRIWYKKKSKLQFKSCVMYIIGHAMFVKLREILSENLMYEHELSTKLCETMSFYYLVCVF